MNFVLGIIFSLIFVAIPYISYNLGKKSQRKSKSDEIAVDKAKELQKKEKEIGFYNVFVDYDVDVAAGRREQLDA